MKKKEKENSYIYVVLVKALTGLGKIARLTSKYEYTHIAVCLDENLNKFYTFSRRKHYSPFNSGYMVETLDCYAFGKHTKIKLKVFKLPVSQDNKKEIEEYINQVSKDSKYIFNFLSMITMPIFHGFEIYKSHNCMSFVSKIIELAGTIKLIKPYYKYNIKEIDELLTKYFYKEDFFLKNNNETSGYMSYVGVIRNIYSFLILNIKLCYRLITKSKEFR